MFCGAIPSAVGQFLQIGIERDPSPTP